MFDTLERLGDCQWLKERSWNTENLGGILTNYEKSRDEKKGEVRQWMSIK